MAVKKRRWWMIAATVLLALILLAVVSWQTLIVYIAPKMVLAGALKETVAELEKRIASGPIPVLARGIDPEGRNRVVLRLDAYNAFVGTVGYDMDVLIQKEPRRILAGGKAVFQNTEIDLSLYLDEDFAAVSSQGILGGNYYGLTYDTFPQDIRSNKLMSMLIGETVLQSWESKIQTLQDVMQQEIPELPDFSRLDLKALAMGILALDADVERVRIDLNGTKETYHVISFETSGAEIASGLDYLNLETSFALDADEEVEFSFWLKDRKLGKMEISMDEQELDVYWGTPPVSFISEEDIYIAYYDGANLRTWTISAQQTENQYRETITYVGEEKIQISYDWTASTGDLMLQAQTKGECTELALKLTPLETGFSAATDDFGALMHLLIGTEDSADHPCTMTVTKGADFETPEYKKFVDWSTEDMLALLSGFGSLLGLKLP